MFHLIGVNHDAQQYDADAPLSRDQDELWRCLLDAVGNIQPEVIGVEESKDTLGSRISIPCRIAADQVVPVPCILCEPCESYRSQHKLLHWVDIQRRISTSDWCRKIRQEDHAAAAMALQFDFCFPLREDFWISKLVKFLGSEVIFVLGDNHIESFCERLLHRGVSSEVVARGIGPTDRHSGERLKAECFQRDNQGLFDELLHWYSGS